MSRLAFLATFALCVAPLAFAQMPPDGWPAPGDGFDWQPLGDRPLATRHLSFDTQGRLWAAGYTADGNVSRLDLAADPQGEWIHMNPPRSGDRVLALGRGDTVLVGEGFMHRSTDGGDSWTQTDIGCRLGNGSLFEVAPDTPPGPWGETASHLISGYRGLCRSQDRGATWETILQSESSQFDLRHYDTLVLPAGHAHAGRLVSGTTEGVWLSDESQTTLMLRKATGGLLPNGDPLDDMEHLALLPSGRLLATGFFSGQPSRRAFVSDDGGESWRQTQALPEPADGIGGDAWLAVIGERTAVAVGARGVVYRTDDDGETWAIMGRVPITETVLTSRHLLIGPQGRLHVGVVRAGPSDEGAWAYRTSSPLVVAGSETAPASELLGVTVRPNPSASGAVTVKVSVESPVEVRAVVVDALGRTVAEILSGPVTGARTVEVDTAGWAAGVYAVVVEVDGERVVEAFTVVR